MVLRAGVAEVHQPAEAGMVISIDRVSVPPCATRTKSSVLALMGLLSGVNAMVLVDLSFDRG